MNKMKLLMTDSSVRVTCFCFILVVVHTHIRHSAKVVQNHVASITINLHEMRFKTI